ncbi:cytochrome o ubiquinol oxidase subunit III [Fulvimarina sp. 2208YS6-2-32]|uniref:Cytochrome bo(3) ubiquinol oxidase subunit 3 n=1 Tax=Fulvimarina uroteuthidis TaxID=3098149 RepID=A0ABU5I4B3_9HYPH|nr:cytochrome o ubiquinol oxidase subunit III [Fulvimarina sp. 2208YS6-2-32]MDY8110219.1 cytochrome o ubiquinol oxidase subunit III [Fulvimarina sp. 2208YS6-2-32]
MSSATNTATTPPEAFFALEEHEHAAGSSTMLGFWFYLMSDCLIFAVLFATYGVLAGNYAAGPRPEDIFELHLVAVNTGLLLFSSITYGFAMIAMQARRKALVLLWLGVTGLLGACFLGIELYEFGVMIAEGATPQRSGFLSSFFTLVGTHGLHVAFGLVWLATLMIQIGSRGLIDANRRRVMCLSMFWHFLDVVWIGVFTFVYLIRMI